MRTNVSHIYAIGDCTGKLALAHVASAMGIVGGGDHRRRRDVADPGGPLYLHAALYFL